jgi:hypothetical protein
MPRRPAITSPLAAAASAAGVELVARAAVADAHRVASKLRLRLRAHGATDAQVSVAYDADDVEAVLTARER